MRPISLPGSRSRRLIALGSVVVALITGYAALQAYAGTGVPRGTRIGPLDVGGLSYEAAVQRIQEAYERPASRVFHVHVGERAFALPIVARAVVVDAEATVAQEVGGRINPWRLISMMRGEPLTLHVHVDDVALMTAVQRIARATRIAPVDATIDMSGQVPVVTNARAGLGLDAAQAVHAIVNAALAAQDGVTLRRIEQPAIISTLVAQRALEQIALPAISDSVTVDLAMEDGSHRTSVIGPDTIRAALTFVPSGSLLAPELDGMVLRRDVDTSLMDVQVFAKRAKFRITGESITVVPSVEGYGVSATSIAQDVLRVLGEESDSRTVTLHMGPITPAFTTEDAQALGITELVSTYTQKFPPAAYRTQNIGTAARYIQGTILKPGDTFSMNDTVKERTVENGYTEGWIIGPDGVFRMEQGGAVSTITTAVFNAAWFAGLKLVEHRAHSIYISRYPAGREATVSWGSFDMKFRNNLKHAILITTKLRRDSISVSFWGTSEWQRIDSEFGPWTDQRPYPEIQSTNPECHDQDGMPGFHITVWRTFFRDGVEVKREPYRTSYRPSPHVVCAATVSGADRRPTAPKPTPKPTPRPTVTPSPVTSPTETATA